MLTVDDVLHERTTRAPNIAEFALATGIVAQASDEIALLVTSEPIGELMIVPRNAPGVTNRREAIHHAIAICIIQPGELRPVHHIGSLIRIDEQPERLVQSDGKPTPVAAVSIGPPDFPGSICNEKVAFRRKRHRRNFRRHPRRQGHVFQTISGSYRAQENQSDSNHEEMMQRRAHGQRSVEMPNSITERAGIRSRPSTQDAAP